MRLGRFSSAPTFERTCKQTYSLLVPHTEFTNFSRAILPRCENGRAGWHQPCPRSKTARPTESSRKSSFTGSWSDPSMILAPGEGFIIAVGTTMTRSFVGEVAQGYSVNQVPNLQSIRSSIVPQAGRVVTDLHLPVISGDTVTRMINGTYVGYTYTGGGVWSPSEPSVSIGESFWNNKGVGFWWHRNFLVWP